MQRARIEISFLVFRSRAKQMSQRPSPAWLHQAGVGSVPTWFTLKPTGFLSIDFLNGPPPFWANPRTLLMADENHNITGKQFLDPMCIWFNQNLEETKVTSYIQDFHKNNNHYIPLGVAACVACMPCWYRRACVTPSGQKGPKKLQWNERNSTRVFFGTCGIR